MRLSDVEGDSELAEFCRLEWPRLVGSLTLYTGERDLAEDLAQEALIRACQHWAKVREAASRSAWVHRVAFNLAKSQFRRRATLRRVQRLEIVESSTREPDAALHLAVRSAVGALPEPQRRALVLRYFSDLPVREVATLMGCPANTVKTHTRRALEALRDAGLISNEVAEPSHVAAEGMP